MSTKLRIKFGQLELDYEGEEQFLRDGIPALLTSMAEVHPTAAAASEPADRSGGSDGDPKPPASGGQLALTTTTIAARLGVKTGGDLVVAAAARLALVLSRDEFTRQELIREMRGGVGYFKPTYIDNLSSYVQGKIKAGELIETTPDVYTLSAPTKARLEQALPSSGGRAADGNSGSNGAGSAGPLGPYLKAVGPRSEVERFLATAVWLHGRGQHRLTTGLITRALLDNHQTRLSNASDCLAKNINKGYCEKAGGTFFVTDPGRESLRVNA